jgi:hypothetical protein
MEKKSPNATPNFKSISPSPAPLANSQTAPPLDLYKINNDRPDLQMIAKSYGMPEMA